MTIARVSFIVIAVMLLTACAQTIPLPPEVVGESQPGFWKGLLHGMILFFSFIGSLFNDDIAIYAVNNSGGWYDFGFLLGVGTFSGTVGKAR